MPLIRHWLFGFIGGSVFAAVLLSDMSMAQTNVRFGSEIPTLFQMPAGDADELPRRIRIRQSGLLLGTLEVPPNVTLTVQPREQSVATLKLDDNSALELAPDASVRIRGWSPSGDGAPPEIAVRIAGAALTLERPQR